jgi:hypothetical protein
MDDHLTEMIIKRVVSYDTLMNCVWTNNLTIGTIGMLGPQIKVQHLSLM